MHGIINEEEDLMFANELELLSIGIISLPLHILDTIVVNIMQDEKITKTIKCIIKHTLFPKGSGKFILNKELEASLKDKMCILKCTITIN